MAIMRRPDSVLTDEDYAAIEAHIATLPMPPPEAIDRLRALLVPPLDVRIRLAEDYLRRSSAA